MFQQFVVNQFAAFGGGRSTSMAASFGGGRSTNLPLQEVEEVVVVVKLSPVPPILQLLSEAS